MYFYFLIEDQSSAALVQILMEKLKNRYPSLLYECRAFKGLGGFPKKGTMKDAKTGKLLNDLATYLRGFNQSLKGIEAAVFILLDNDKRDTKNFRTQLEYVAEQNNITIDHAFCIAVEEMEAWLLGDQEAIRQAYPKAKMQIVKEYEQDSICGTWEKLADAVYPGGIKQMKAMGVTYIERGKYKAEWARAIGAYMEIERNQSPSFQRFIQEVETRLDDSSAVA